MKLAAFLYLMFAALLGAAPENQVLFSKTANAQATGSRIRKFTTTSTETATARATATPTPDPRTTPTATPLVIR